ncbi:hypothetical protein [Parasphingorhabdus flavimaris]|uniref:hypothetical protein n=1 Tax=Parasphingorhabdus flavimaris TaxID=266812 RepID=UPI003002B010
MIELTLADDFKHIFNLYRAVRHRSNKRLENAKFQVEKALAYGCRAPHYPLALVLKAELMFREGGQLNEGRACLHECMSALEKDHHADDTYIAAYCQAWLAMTDEKIGYAEIEDRALNANAYRKHTSRFTKMILRQFTIDELKKIFGMRAAKSSVSFIFDGSNKAVNVEVGFSF